MPVLFGNIGLPNTDLAHECNVLRHLHVAESDQEDDPEKEIFDDYSYESVRRRREVIVCCSSKIFRHGADCVHPPLIHQASIIILILKAEVGQNQILKLR